MGCRAARLARKRSLSVADSRWRLNRPAIMGPGLSTLVLMPCRAWSMATVRASWRTAALVAL